MLRLRTCTSLLLAGLPAVIGCSSDDRPPPLPVSLPPTDAGADAPGAAADAKAGSPIDLSGPGAEVPREGDCGKDVFPVQVEPPTIYLLIDASGSMSNDATPGGPGLNRYRAVKLAIADLLRAIGHRLQYGAAVFPGGTDGCIPGREVFAPARGDPLSYVQSGQDGPRLQALISVLEKQVKIGGRTPLSPTLEHLEPALLALGERTFLVLLTDGAPNCNIAARCPVSECSPNLLGLCEPTMNCCDPHVTGDEAAGENCVDRAASELAVTRLGAAGISTFVVGIPGSELFGAVLDDLAVAGGTARKGDTKYYAAADTDELSAVLSSIGESIAMTCVIGLSSAPPDPNEVNVYFDIELLPQDSEHGWVWASATTIELVGDACARFKSGDVQQIEVLANCPTVIR